MRKVLLFLAGWPVLASAVPLEVVNPGGEINSGVDRTPVSDPSVTGWKGGGQVINDRTDYGNGGWRLSFEDSEALWQMTPHVIVPGASYALRFDAALFTGAPGGGDFAPDLALIGGSLRNGDFNADTSGTDSRTFAETPVWENLGSAGAGSQATRTSPANLLSDGTRNAVISTNHSRIFAADTGYTLTGGEVFRVMWQWIDGSGWSDTADRVAVVLFTTDDDTLAGTRTDLQTLTSGVSAGDGLWQDETAVSAPVPAAAAGRRLFVRFEGVDGNGDNAGFGRVDNFVLERGVSGVTPAPRRIIAELVTQNGTNREVIAGRAFDFKSGVPGSWRHYHLAVPPGALDGAAGKALGIQFRASDAGDGNFQSVDNVRLDTWPADAADGAFADDWNTTPDQVWLGPGWWANRLHDWQVRGGRVNCITGDRDRRTAHMVGAGIRGNGGAFSFRVRTGRHAGTLTSGARAGLLLGAGPNLDWRGALLVHDGLGRDFGIFAGLSGDGAAVIEDMGEGGAATLATGAVPAAFPAAASLTLDATYDPVSGDCTLTLSAADAAEAVFSTATARVPSDRVLGSYGILSHRGGADARFWFDDFSGTGAALQPEPERHLAILGALYTVSRGVLKLSAHLSPLDLASTPPVTLETWNGTAWQLAGTAPVDNTDGLSSCTATFRIAGWDSTRDTPYRLAVSVAGRPFTWEGVIRRDPVEKDEVVIGAMTCQRINDGAMQNDGFDWSPVMVWQPHPLAYTHMRKHRPDILLALGDQIYEGQPTPEDSGTDFNRHYDYLYKWELWMLQAQDLARDTPVVCLPDDHDVYHGNLWGEGGIATTSQDTGGYEEPAAWVKMVERTQTSHLPDADPYSATQPPAPVAQGIPVYFTGMTWGRVGIAILEDRKFKTGPSNPPADLSQQHLLGERQHAFLRAWNADWAGQDVKLVASQSPFGNVHTHANTGYGIGINDKDTHGWPVHRRNEAWDLLRRSRMFQIAGDQHLSTVVHHGIAAPADAGYSFTAPAVANFFPRAFDPAHFSPGTTDTVSPYTGDFYFDGTGTLPGGGPNLQSDFPHHIRVLAAGNPHEYYNRTRNINPAHLHDRGAGYGVVRVVKSTRRITFESWPLHADPEFPQTGAQFDGWPLTISQTDNDGRTPAGFLPVLDTRCQENAVVRVIDEATGELVHAMRIRGQLYRAPVYADGIYRLEILTDDGGPAQVLAHQTAAPAGPAAVHSFRALQPAIARGGTATLQWDVTPGADSLVIDQGVGDVRVVTVEGIGQVRVSPQADTTYTLTRNGVLSAQTQVRVFAPVEVWKATYFTPAEVADPLVSGDAADADGDGVSNAVEFQFQTDPRDAASAPRFHASVIRDGEVSYPAFDMPVPAGQGGCGPVIEWSADLENWQDLPPGRPLEITPGTVAPGTPRISVVVREPLPAGPEVPALYYRARWVLPEAGSGSAP